mmetsp:Transcript_43821/g.70433  ORF Transcript_43821/g.70433 Transcript_43821/m.70433 type:complete len:228 (-) Transcript_43821:338-1021(-)
MPLLSWTLTAVLACCTLAGASAQKLSDERVVLQTTKGDLELAFYPEVAPQTVRHILRLARRGLYNTNHFFRVDKGFVAQVADVVGGRTAPMDAHQKAIASDSVQGEFSELKHVRGTLSMARYDDPNSGTSSFSILLGAAPHLDSKYAVFGRLVAGEEVLSAMEAMPTRKEGMFVMPNERLTILSSYVKEPYEASTSECILELRETKHRADGLAVEIEKTRQKRLPGM